jgi:sec-independent protein translocase protein TatA
MVMGIGGLHIWHLLIILLICVMIFGTKRLKDIGGDLGGAVKGFRKAMSDADEGRDDPKQLGQKDAEFPEAGEAKRDSDRSRGA